MSLEEADPRCEMCDQLTSRTTPGGYLRRLPRAVLRQPVTSLRECRDLLPR